MSPPLDLITPLRVSCPPARCWPVPLISHLALQFFTSEMCSELLEGLPSHLSIREVVRAWHGSSLLGEMIRKPVELGWLIMGLGFPAPDSGRFACILLCKADRSGVLSVCALGQLPPGEGQTERCLWWAERRSCLFWIALDLLYRKNLSWFCSIKEQPGSRSEKDACLSSHLQAELRVPSSPDLPDSLEFIRVCKALMKGLGGH